MCLCWNWECSQGGFLEVSLQFPFPPLYQMLIIVHASFNQVQNLLGHCSQHLDKGETHQGPAVIGIAMVAMAEELGLEMAIRSLEHLLQYGEQNIRRAVPLALGLLCISNPKVILVVGLTEYPLALYGLRLSVEVI